MPSALEALVLPSIVENRYVGKAALSWPSPYYILGTFVVSFNNAVQVALRIFRAQSRTEMPHLILPRVLG